MAEVSRLRTRPSLPLPGKTWVKRQGDARHWPLEGFQTSLPFLPPNADSGSFQRLMAHLQGSIGNVAVQRLLGDTSGASVQLYGTQRSHAVPAGSASAEETIPAIPHMVLRQPLRDPGSAKQTPEEKERSKLLTEFTGGAELPDQQVSKIASAMRAFSLHQLRAMRNAGVRFWAPDSLPPEFKDRMKVDNVSTPGEYLDLIHVIRMSRNASTDAIRHEMAHAWDHARTGKVKPIAKLKGKDFERALENTPPLLSETKQKRATRETRRGKVSNIRLSISEMFERYKKWALREASFDNPSTRESYSKTSPREFYAEGYSVFHSGREFNQARLLYYAPELYELLEAEAKQEGLAVPDRSKVEAAMKEQKLQ
jgi:hypothetical protein